MMQRRQFLVRVAGLATAATLPGPVLAGGRPDRIVVVGGGIIGAAIAYRLARRGARITLVDRVGASAGATSRSFAWLNAEFSKRPLHYHALSRLGLSSYRVLEQELPGLPVQWGGAVQWCTEAAAAEDLRRQVRVQQEWGYPVRLIDAAQLHALEGEIRAGDARAATFADEEGFADPAATTQLLLDKAREAGAEIVFPCEVVGLALAAGRISAVITTRGDIAADLVVVAAGVDTPTIAAMAGIDVPLLPAPGLLVHTRPMAPLLHHVAIGPVAHFKQYRDGRVVIGDDFGPPTTAAHDSLHRQPADFPDATIRDLHAQRILKQAARYLPALADAPVDRVTLGWRPLPRDGYPIVGRSARCPNLYLAVTHSGITLAAVLSELASIEMLDGVEVQALAPYRPTRFAAG
jgi:glycine/D-amino acid oxidase-like deaminating enzyme